MTIDLSDQISQSKCAQHGKTACGHSCLVLILPIGGKKQCEIFQPNITMGKTTKTTTTKLLRAIGQATFCSLWGCHFRHNFLRYTVTILKQIVRHSDVFKMALIL